MKNGFTLIELLVVVSIISLLSSITLTSLGSARSKARDASRVVSIKQIQNALEMYYIDHGSYPPVSLPVNISELGSSLTPQYISSIKYDMTNVGSPGYYRTSTNPDSYLIHVILEKEFSPGVHGCRTGVGPTVDLLYPSSPKC